MNDTKPKKAATVFDPLDRDFELSMTEEKVDDSPVFDPLDRDFELSMTEGRPAPVV